MMILKETDFIRTTKRLPEENPQIPDYSGLPAKE